MIRRSPAEYYLKYLLLAPEGWNDTAIQYHMEDRGIYCPNPRRIEELRKSLRPPTYFQPTNRLHKASSDFLKAEKVYTMFHPDSYTRMSVFIFERPSIKQFIETSISQHASYMNVCNSLSVLKNFACNARSVEVYCHYFWNTELLTRTELQEVTYMLGWISQGDPNATAMEVKAERWAHYNDPLALAACMPANAYSQAVVRFYEGYFPRVETNSWLKYVFYLGLVKLVEHLSKSGYENMHTAALITQTLEGIRRLIESTGSPTDDIMSLAKQMTLTCDPTPQRTMADITGGRHTIDMMPASDGSYVASEVQEAQEVGAEPAAEEESDDDEDLPG